MAKNSTHRPTYINLPDKLWLAIGFRIPHVFDETWNPNNTLRKAIEDLMAFEQAPLQLAAIEASFCCMDTEYWVEETIPNAHPYQFLYLNSTFQPHIFRDKWPPEALVQAWPEWNAASLWEEISHQLAEQSGNCGAGTQAMWSALRCDASFLHLPELEGLDTYPMSYNYQWSYVPYPVVQTALGSSIGGPCNYDTRPPLSVHVSNGPSELGLWIYPDWSYFTHPYMPGWSLLQHWIGYLKDKGWEMTHGEERLSQMKDTYR